MLTALVVLLRYIGLLCRGHRAVVLENVALRQQLAALTRTTKRPRPRTTDRVCLPKSPSARSGRYTIQLNCVRGPDASAAQQPAAVHDYLGRN